MVVFVIGIFLVLIFFMKEMLYEEVLVNQCKEMVKIYYQKVEKKKKEKIVEKKGKIKKKEEKFNGKIFDYDLVFNVIVFF